MRDFREAKAMARSLRTGLDAMGFKITVDQSLELIACSFGVADWNTLDAAIGLEPSAAAARDSPSLPGPESTVSRGFSAQLVSTLNQTLGYAKAHQQEQMKLEHLLLSLLDDADAAPVMKACGVDLRVLRDDLTRNLGNEPRRDASEACDPSPTVSLQRVLQRAVIHARNSDSTQLGGAQVLVALFGRERQPRGPVAPGAGHEPLGCLQFHQPRPHSKKR